MKKLRVPFEYVYDILTIVTVTDQEEKLTKAQDQKLKLYFSKELTLYFSDYVKSQCLFKVGGIIGDDRTTVAIRSYEFLTGDKDGNIYVSSFKDLVTSFNHVVSALFNKIKDANDNGEHLYYPEIGIIAPDETKMIVNIEGDKITANSISFPYESKRLDEVTKEPYININERTLVSIS